MGVALSIAEREIERERLHVTGKSLGFLKICWYLYGYIAINYFGGTWTGGNQCACFQGIANKGIKHCWDTVICGVIVFDPPGTSSLDHFNILSVLFGIKTLNSSGILSTCGRTRGLYASSFTDSFLVLRFPFISPRVLFALPVILLIHVCLFQFRSWDMVSTV